MAKGRKSMKPKTNVPPASAVSDKPVFQCEICVMSFNKKPLFTKHMMEHAEQKAFECDKCDRNFRSKDGLLRHMITHANEKKGPSSRKSMPGKLNASSRKSLKNTQEVSNMSLMFDPCAPPQQFQAREVAAKSPGATSPKSSAFDLLQKSISPKLANVRKSVGQMYTSLVKTVLEQTRLEEEEEESFAELMSYAKETPSNHLSRKSFSSFECDICHHSFDSAVSFTDHMKKHAEKNQFMCNICNEVFMLKSQFNKHMAEHSRELSLNASSSGSESAIEEVYECNVCGLTFAEEDSLKNHLLRHSSRKLLKPKAVTKYFECNVCKCGFSEKSHLASHVEEHYDRFPFACEVCHAAFSRKVMLNRHSCKQEMEVSDDDEVEIVYKSNHECAVCSESFPSQEQLEKHLLEHSSAKSPEREFEKGQLFECNVCGCGFRKMDHLRQHVKEHASKYPYVCATCCSAFQRKLHLNRHASEHQLSPATSNGSSDSVHDVQVVLGRCSSKSPAKTLYRCEVCRSSFVLKAHLLKHMMSHPELGEAFDCDKCSETFDDEQEFKAHVREHADQEERESHNGRVFKCNICSGEFSTNEQLAEHVGDHRDLFPFSCKICHSCFPRKVQLSKHVAEHSIEEECPESRDSKNESKQQVKNKLKSSKHVYKCSSCPESFEDEEELLEHVTEFHENDGFHGNVSQSQQRLLPPASAFECGICHSTFPEKMELIMHTMKHMNEVVVEDRVGDRKREADECYEERRAGLSRELARSAASPAKSFVCQYCEMCFRDERLFSEHMDMHTGNEVPPRNRLSSRHAGPSSKIDPHAVLEDEEVQSTLPSVVRGKSNHECKVCHKSFKTKIALNCHLVSHTGKKPLKREPNTKAAIISSMAHAQKQQQMAAEGLFECNICRTRFPNKGLRTKHIISNHSNKKPFECDECSREFWSKDGLDRHVKTHAGTTRVR